MNSKKNRVVCGLVCLLGFILIDFCGGRLFSGPFCSGPLCCGCLCLCPCPYIIIIINIITQEISNMQLLQYFADISWSTILTLYHLSKLEALHFFTTLYFSSTPKKVVPRINLEICPIGNIL